MMTSYSPAFKARVVQRLVGPGADAGFVSVTTLHEFFARDYTPHVQPRCEERTERAQGKRARRWVVEVAH